jgi:putative PIN family toxin of toxin-antitoxin system
MDVVSHYCDVAGDMLSFEGMRIVLDTDVLVAASRSATGASRQLLLAGMDRRIVLLVSPALVLEYDSVLKRPEHLRASQTDEKAVDIVLNLLVASADQVALHYLWRPQLTDVGDELVLEAAINGQADAIVTFNVRDFEVGARKFGLKVCRPGEFWRSL